MGAGPDGGDHPSQGHAGLRGEAAVRLHVPPGRDGRPSCWATATASGCQICVDGIITPSLCVVVCGAIGLVGLGPSTTSSSSSGSHLAGTATGRTSPVRLADAVAGPRLRQGESRQEAQGEDHRRAQRRRRPTPRPRPREDGEIQMICMNCELVDGIAVCPYCGSTGRARRTATMPVIQSAPPAAPAPSPAYRAEDIPCPRPRSRPRGAHGQSHRSHRARSRRSHTAARRPPIPGIPRPRPLRGLLPPGPGTPERAGIPRARARNRPATHMRTTTAPPRAVAGRALPPATPTGSPPHPASPTPTPTGRTHMRTPRATPTRTTAARARPRRARAHRHTASLRPSRPATPTMTTATRAAQMTRTAADSAGSARRAARTSAPRAATPAASRSSTRRPRKPKAASAPRRRRERRRSSSAFSRPRATPARSCCARISARRTRSVMSFCSRTAPSSSRRRLQPRRGVRGRELPGGA